MARKSRGSVAMRESAVRGERLCADRSEIVSCSKSRIIAERFFGKRGEACPYFGKGTINNSILSPAD